MEETKLTVTTLSQIEKDKQVKSVLGEAHDLAARMLEHSINSAETYKEASELLTAARAALNSIDARRKFFTEPHNLFVKAINNFFAGATDELKRQTSLLGSSMATYDTKVREEADRKEREILAAQKKGKISEEKAATKLAAIDKPAEVTRTAAGSVSFRIDRKLKITDASKLPRQFLVPNEKLIEATLKAGKAVAGAELVEVKVPVTRNTGVQW